MRGSSFLKVLVKTFYPPENVNANRLAQSGEHWTTVREGAGLNPGLTNTQGLKITEEKVLPL